ncbi:MAG: DUF3106 domain-containing protein [Alphaproteobacteria bacterium]|nr:DUF3106 domain-containing protein [Alphaproteobacteria bacterium]
MANIKFTSLISLAGLLLIAGMAMAHADIPHPKGVANGDPNSVQKDQLPPDIMRGELGEKMGDKLKAMSPEDRKAFIEKIQARKKEMREKFAKMTPEERQQMKEMREKLMAMTPEQRLKLKNEKELLNMPYPAEKAP